MTSVAVRSVQSFHAARSAPWASRRTVTAVSSASAERSLLQPGHLSCQAHVCPWMVITIKTRRAGMMAAGNATVTMGRKCVPSSPAQCLPAATPPSGPDSAAHPAQMTSWCRSPSSARLPFATPLEESTLWKGKRGTLTPVRSAPVTVAECCVRRRCAHHCSARTPHAPRTPAAHSVQRTLFSLPHPIMRACLATAGMMKGTSSWRPSPGSLTSAPAACAWIAPLAATPSLALQWPANGPF